MVTAERSAMPALVMFVPVAAVTIIFLQILALMTLKQTNPVPALPTRDQLVAAAAASPVLLRAILVVAEEGVAVLAVHDLAAAALGALELLGALFVVGHEIVTVIAAPVPSSHYYLPNNTVSGLPVEL